MLCGDFNYPSDKEDLLHTVTALGFEPACDGSSETHVLGNKLDWVFTRNCGKRPSVEIVKQPIDHHVLRFELRGAEVLPTLPDKPRYGRLAKLNDEELADFHKGLSSTLQAAVEDPGCKLSNVREAIVPFCNSALGSRKASGYPPKAWWNRGIKHRRAVWRRAKKAHSRLQSGESLLRVKQAESEYLREIRRSKQRADRDAVEKVRRGLEPLHVLTRGKQGPTHQRLTVRDGETQTFHGFWKSVFADGDPLPPPPLPQPDDPLSIPESHSVPPAPEDPPGPWYSSLHSALRAISSSLFNEEDVRAAVKSMKNKAPGEDGIPVSVFKGKFKCEEEVVQVIDLYAATLADVFNHAVQFGLPVWSKEGLGRWIWKGKGSVDNPDDYRLIVLQPILMKILERMVDLRLRRLIDQGLITVSVEQGGFMTERSTYDSIFLLHSLQDGARKLKQPLYTAFLDVKKAFDSVSHQRLLRTLEGQGVPQVWVAVIHHLLSDRCTFLGDMEVPIQRGTPQGSPLSPLLFILFMEPLISRLRAGSRGVELAPTAFIRCLLFADDVCLTASSLEDLQRMLHICSEWAADMAMVFNTSKSHLLHLAGQPYDANVALVLSGKPLQWTTEVLYLGVPIRKGRAPSSSLPFELPRAWAALHNAGAALTPAVPAPLSSQLKMVNSDVLAGVLYPAAVHDLDYGRIDRFVNSLLRRLTGCERGSSATFLRCETGLLPSKFLGHRRALQFWRHISHDAWFAPLVPSFHGQGPLKRLTGIAAVYGLSETTVLDVSTGVSYPFDKDRWKEKVREVVDNVAVEHLQKEAADRQLPGPQFVRRKRDNGEEMVTLLKLVPRPYVAKGGDLAKHGVVFRHCAVLGRFASWNPWQHAQPCRHCSTRAKFGDPYHVFTCPGAPADFLEARKRVLRRLGLPANAPDTASRFADMKWAKGDAVWLKAGLNLMRKAYKLAQHQPND